MISDTIVETYYNQKLYLKILFYRILDFIRELVIKEKVIPT